MKIGDKIEFIGGACYSPSHINIGKIYTVIGFDSDDDPEFINDIGIKDCYYRRFFKVVSEATDPVDLIGKTVLYKGKPFKVETFTVFNKYYSTDNKTIIREVEQSGYSYVLENEYGFAPLSEVSPINNTVKLNDEYNAVIEGDIVKVGCQEIPIQKVMEIVDLYKTLL